MTIMVWITRIALVGISVSCLAFSVLNLIECIKEAWWKKKIAKGIDETIEIVKEREKQKSQWKTIKADGYPPIGKKLLCTIKNKDDDKNIISMQRYFGNSIFMYRKNDRYPDGIWEYLIYSDKIKNFIWTRLPDNIEVVAWMLLPESYKEENNIVSDNDIIYEKMSETFEVKR